MTLMKCPTCVAEGTRSRIEVGPATRTLMGFMPYYDEDGTYHVNDPNVTTTRYRCSRGHSWSVKEMIGKRPHVLGSTLVVGTARCVCGHTQMPHLDEGGSDTWCYDCWLETSGVIACHQFIQRVPGWEYVRGPREVR